MTGTPPRRVFVGISGASGAPYAVRLVQSLAAAGCELQLSISDSGMLVLAARARAGSRRARRGDGRLPRARRGDPPRSSRRTTSPRRRRAAAASRTRPSICPCSVGTAAHIALGTTRTLIHRVGDVALKERRPLVLVPRETPLTQIHLRRLLELAEAGAIVLPAMPGFYTRPADAAGCGRPRRRQGPLRARLRADALPALGRGTALTPPAADERGRARRARPAHRPRPAAHPGHVQRHLVSRYDVMNHLMTVGLDRRWRRIAAEQTGAGPGRAGPRRLLRYRRSHIALAAMFTAVGGDRPRLHGGDARAARAPRARGVEARGLPAPRFVQGDLLALPFADGEFAAVTVGWGVRNVPDVPRAFAEMRRVTRPGGRVVCLESTQPPPGLGGRFHLVWMGRVVPLLGRLVTGDPDAYAYLPGLRGGLPARGGAGGDHEPRRPRRACATGASASAPSPCTSARCRDDAAPGGAVSGRQALSWRSARPEAPLLARHGSRRRAASDSRRNGYPGALGDACRATLAAGRQARAPAAHAALLRVATRSCAEPVLRAAASVELLHMATLVHDDILDRAELRRGRATVAHEYRRRRRRLFGQLPARPRLHGAGRRRRRRGGRAPQRHRRRPLRRRGAAARRRPPRHGHGRRLRAALRAQDGGSVLRRLPPRRACCPAPATRWPARSPSSGASSASPSRSSTTSSTSAATRRRIGKRPGADVRDGTSHPAADPRAASASPELGRAPGAGRTSTTKPSAGSSPTVARCGALEGARAVALGYIEQARMVLDACPDLVERELLNEVAARVVDRYS